MIWVTSFRQNKPSDLKGEIKPYVWRTLDTEHPIHRAELEWSGIEMKVWVFPDRQIKRQTKKKIAFEKN